jgi:hypothetical protein
MVARELSSSPSMKTLYPKALGGSVLPLMRKLPGVGGAPRELPAEELVLRDATIDRERLEEYCRVCTFQIRNAVPATYPHLLAFPLSMRLMTGGAFPFPVIGLVHIENRIRQRRPIGVDERLEMRVRTADLRSHDKGRQFDVIAEATVGGESVWHSTSTYLRRGGGDGSASRDRGERPQPPAADTQLTVPADIGRRYAGVSGDRNPIHLHPLTARLFGLPKPIAHGMWLKARCLALLEAGLPDAYEVKVSFKLPVYLPGRVSFASRDGDFALHDDSNSKPHLSGEMSV